ASQWGWTGALCGAVAWIDPGALVPSLVVLFVLGYRRRDAVRPAIAILTIAITVAPWIARNSLVFGRPTYLRDNAGLEVWYAVRQSIEGDVSIDRWNPGRNNAEGERMASLGEAAYFDAMGANAIAAIRAAPLHYAGQAISTWSRFWLGGYRVEELGWPSAPAVSKRLAYAALPVVAWVGWWKCYRRRRTQAIAVGLFLLTFSLPY